MQRQANKPRPPPTQLTHPKPASHLCFIVFFPFNKHLNTRTDPICVGLLWKHPQELQEPEIPRRDMEIIPGTANLELVLDPAAATLQRLQGMKIMDQGRAEEGKRLPGKPGAAGTVRKTLQPFLGHEGPSVLALCPHSPRGCCTSRSCGPWLPREDLTPPLLLLPADSRGCSPSAARGHSSCRDFPAAPTPCSGESWNPEWIP